MKKNKGFTLIELLVVIAIIGLLSTIVLVSLNSARNKAKDTRIKADIGQIRSVAELYADTIEGGYYDGLPTAGAPFGDQYTTLLTDINAQVAQTVVFNATVTPDVAAYAVQAQLTGTDSYWCADSTGVSRAETVVLDVATACP